MGDKTDVEWTEATWNVLRGCSRKSKGCINCYAEGIAARFSGPGLPYEGLAVLTSQGPKWTGKVRFVPEALELPLRWKRPRMIFVNSMSDLFHESVADETVDQIFAVMALAGQHTFQTLTKRADRMHAYLTNRSDVGWRVWRLAEKLASDRGIKLPQGDRPWPLPNVWLGVCVEDQAAADERIPSLLTTPAALRWISAEPLLGAVDLERVRWWPDREHYVDALRAGFWTNGPLVSNRSWRPGEQRGHFVNHSDMLGGIDWVVVGGESGPKARITHPEWPKHLRDQCAAAGVPFFFKQHGVWGPGSGDFGAGRFRTAAIARDGRIVPGGYQKAEYPEGATAEDGWAMVHRCGKRAAGRLLDGVLHDAFPGQMTRRKPSELRRAA